MVQLAQVKDHNRRFANEQHGGNVCVFVGATRGIGAGTLTRMATMIHKSTFYILGRSAKRAEEQLETLRASNPSNKFIFIEVDVTLLSGVDAACEQIAEAERKIDYLCMSAGLVPLNGAEYTKEGLEIAFALSFYSRMRMISNLLPLLHRSPRPRILSVLNAGREKKIDTKDLGLERKWAVRAMVNHTTTMTTLAFDHLAPVNEDIAFLHAFPGLVQTEIFSQLTAPESSGIAWRIGLAAVRVLTAIGMRLVGISPQDSGERHAFHLTSDTFGPGAHRIDETSKEVVAPGVLEEYRKGGWPEKVWEYTLEVFDKVTTDK
ncbi:hypothetical protein PV08_11791 [Exophiala spinifera]|uniref:Ketoreductase (KR) domain-containing protein n=1 Tax=Exophiala spinifera TaxID=91928 RepID=A0A0D2AU97_9EURO|nr:uncharacterized protein PV08_11791 [Exophiala spinifera]KIW10015.1 hypothetical protein PV08_11791 [Exophiala spinifera]